MSDCIFCKIIKGEIPSHKIYEDDYVYAFLDIACDCYGHTLVIPKKHCENVMDCDSLYLAHILPAIQKISRHYVEDCGFSGVNVLNASGKSAEQSVFHLHFHIIPRKENDGLHTWPFNEKYDYDLADVCQKLKLTK